MPSISTDAEHPNLSERLVVTPFQYRGRGINPKLQATKSHHAHVELSGGAGRQVRPGSYRLHNWKTWPSGSVPWQKMRIALVSRKWWISPTATPASSNC